MDEVFKRLRNGKGTMRDVKSILTSPQYHDLTANIPRHELLPFMFKIRGQPYSIADYPQFEPMYSREYTPDLVYICGRQIAKSTNLSRSETLDMLQIPNYQLLYVAPLQAQAQRYSSLYLHEAITTSDLATALQSPAERLGEGPIIKSVAHQAFSNGSGIQMMYAKTSADRARGITADRIDFDEIQDQLIDVIPVIKESTTNSSWGIHRYTGTAKTKDNAIEALWQQSSMAEWVVKCEGCNNFNIPNKDNALNMISVKGPCCHKCGKLLNVRKGSYVHAYPDLADEFPGYHVPQIVVPAITEDPVKWRKLIVKVEKYPESLLFTEVLGISHDSGARLITKEDVANASKLGTHEDLKKRIHRYKFRVLGVDWGIAEVNSFTVSCVLGVTHDGELHVLFGKRYIGQNIEATISDIIKTYRAYDCTICAPDFGVGFTNNQLLVNRGIPVSQIQYVRANKLMSYSELQGVARWSVDRNTALSLVFWGIKYGKIFFPNPEDSADYTRDLLSPYENITELSSGMRSKKFLRDPSSPDDFCHALTFATLMGMRLVGDTMLNIVPEHSIDYTGIDFPEESTVDVDSVLQSFAST